MTNIESSVEHWKNWSVTTLHDGRNGFAYRATYMGVLMAQGWLRTDSLELVKQTALNTGKAMLKEGVQA